MRTFLIVATPFILAGAGALGFLYRHERERRLAVEQKVSELKYRAYTEVISIFFDQFKKQRAQGGFTEADKNSLTERMIDANKDLMLYGSDDVLRLYLNWNREMREGTANLVGLGELIVAIRKDMGSPKTGITADDVLRQFITDYDQAVARGDLSVQRP